jgi:CDP-glucose 4,6-dehydratase
MVTSTFWAGKRVFITGHTGFKGSWLSLWLQQLGATVTGYALDPPTNPSLFEVARVARQMHSVTSDIRDIDKLCLIIKKAAPDIVFHMAAQPLVRYSYSNPVETYAINVMGTINLLEAVRKTGSVRVVVNITSDKCYANDNREHGYVETDPMGGYDPYSNSKGCAELITAAYRDSFFNSAAFGKHHVALASARAGNVIGGGDWASDRLIPDVLRALSEKKTILIRKPSAVRPWQYVLEPLNGYLMLAQNLFTDGPIYAEGWNFGPENDDAKPVKWIVDQLIYRWGGDARWTKDNNENPHEAYYLKLDCTKSHQRLNWRPRWNLSVALDELVAWHKAYDEGLDMHMVCRKQIEKFQKSNCDSR